MVNNHINNIKVNINTSKINNIKQYSMYIALIFIWIFFIIMTGGTFMAMRNLSNLSRQVSIIAILGTGMTLVIITGNIDLSVGSLMGLIGAICAVLQAWYGMGTLPVIIIAILFGSLIGLFNGYLISFAKIPSFVVTLAGLLIFRGLLIAINKGITISPMTESFKLIGQTYLSKEVGYILCIAAILIYDLISIKSRSFKVKYNFKIESLNKFILKLAFYNILIIIFTLIMNIYKGIPIPVIIMLAVIVAFTFVMQRTKFGRYIYAVGGNIEAAFYSGINTKFIILFVFIIMGALSSISGIILTARLNAATVTAGMNMELDAIAASVIGGTSFSGGIGSIPGAILGALIMASLDNGMSLLNMNVSWQYIVKGVVLLVAVLFDVYSKNKE
jgi:D-xylose transport system permease protein